MRAPASTSASAARAQRPLRSLGPAAATANAVRASSTSLRFPDFEVEYGRVASVLRLDRLLTQPAAAHRAQPLRRPGLRQRATLDHGVRRRASWRPLLGLNGDLKNGTRAELKVERRITERRELPARRHSRQHRPQHRRQLQPQPLLLAGPEGERPRQARPRCAAASTLGLVGAYAQHHAARPTRAQRPRASARSSRRDEDRLSSNGTGSYGFSSNVTGNVALGFGQNHDLHAGHHAAAACASSCARSSRSDAARAAAASLAAGRARAAAPRRAARRAAAPWTARAHGPRASTRSSAGPRVPGHARPRARSATWIDARAARGSAAGSSGSASPTRRSAGRSRSPTSSAASARAARARRASCCARTGTRRPWCDQDPDPARRARADARARTTAARAWRCCSRSPSCMRRSAAAGRRRPGVLRRRGPGTRERSPRSSASARAATPRGCPADAATGRVAAFLFDMVGDRDLADPPRGAARPSAAANLVALVLEAARATGARQLPRRAALHRHGRPRPAARGGRARGGHHRLRLPGLAHPPRPARPGLGGEPRRGGPRRGLARLPRARSPAR